MTTTSPILEAPAGGRDLEAEASAARTAELIAAVERLEPQLLAEVEGNERIGRLSPRTLELIAETGLPFAVIPESLGGYGMFLGDALPAVARLAEVDASMGWIGGNWSGTAAFLSYLEPDAAAKLLEGEPAYIGASGAPSGTARRVDGGYRVTGRWAFGSGDRHARYVFVAARLLDEDGQPREGLGGAPAIAMFGVRGDQIVDLGNWDVLGLRATGSIDYTVEDVFVPDEFVVDLFGLPRSGGRQTAGGFISFLPYLHTAFAIGAAARLVRELHAVAGAPSSRGLRLADDRIFRVEYARIVTQVEAARALVFDAWRQVDDRLKRGEQVTRRDTSRVRAACVNAHETLRELAVFVFKRGSGATLHDGPLQRLIRDALAGCQHAIGSDSQYIDIGWDYLGAPDNVVWGDRGLIELPA